MSEDKPRIYALENLTKAQKEEMHSKSADQFSAYRAVKKLSKEGSKWTITQELLQEIMAGHTIADPNKMPPITEMIEELIKEINSRYVEDTDTKEILLASVPHARSVREWVKKEGWDTAVWGYVRAEGLFTASKRSQVIESLRVRALDKSDVAAKIWLQLSGDLVESVQQDNKTVDVFREINNILHNKRNKE